VVCLAVTMASTSVLRVLPRRTLVTRSTQRRPPPSLIVRLPRLLPRRHPRIQMTPWGCPPRPGRTGAPSSVPGSVGRMSRGVSLDEVDSSEDKGFSEVLCVNHVIFFFSLRHPFPFKRGQRFLMGPKVVIFIFLYAA
jgi:hypothetical protein